MSETLAKIANENSFSQMIADIYEDWYDNSEIQCTFINRTVDGAISQWAKNKEWLYHLLGDQLIYMTDSFTIAVPQETIKLNYFKWHDMLHKKIINRYSDKPVNLWIALDDFLSNAVTPEGFATNKSIRDYHYSGRNLYFYIDGRESGESFTIPAGTKIGKALKFFIHDETLLNECQIEYSRYRQKVANNKKGKLCLSIHPYDFITISDNNNNWHSCHNLIDGDYRFGNLEYLGDNVTLVAYYISDTDNNQHALPAFEYRDLIWNSKIWRCLIHIDEEQKMVLYNKAYPFQHEVLTSKVQEVLTPLLEKAFHCKLGKLRHPTKDDNEIYRLHQTFGYCHYDDLTPYNTDYIYVQAPIDTPKEKLRAIEIGEPITCVSCGGGQATDGKDGLCDYCLEEDQYYCPACGCMVHSDETTWVESWQQYLCEDCAVDYEGEICCCVCEKPISDSDFSILEGCEVINNAIYCSDCAYIGHEQEEKEKEEEEE